MISKKDDQLRQVQKLTLPLTRLKGVGPKRADLLARKGLHTILDLLFFTPIRYEDRTQISPISQTAEGIPALVKGRVVYGKEERYFPSRKRLFKIIIKDEASSLELLWFHYRKQHLERFAVPGMELVIYGTVRINRRQRQMTHPDVTVLESRDAGDALGFYPVYSSVKGISENLLRSLIRSALDRYHGSVIDPVPRELTRKLALPGLMESIRFVHFPPKEASIEELNRFETCSHKRLIFDRFFSVMLTIAFRKRHRESASSPISMIPSELMDDIERFFPFRLTSHQFRAVEELIKGFTSGRPMNRLLMGDVGCGKTVVAAVAAYINVRNNRQAAIMVPTQVLANQHMEYFSGLSTEMGFRPVLITGGLKRIEREKVNEGIGKGRYNLILGTHSLIQEEISFADLGLVIIDEQHRFGVRQRALMDKKGENPHLLVMTATPIPRTLAITAYGDMEMSVIREYPEGRMTVETHLIEEERKRWVFETLRQRMSDGRQAFVICPVIEGSEETDLKSVLDMEEALRKILSPSFRIGLIHGNLPPEERSDIMNDFRKGLIDLLVGTTVIEVGVHVPNATVMIIEHPERFGLAQLHQLRGRVGRGPVRGICLLMLSENLPERAMSRLKALADTHDGFDIAQKDLELRGHGELTGMRQSGMGELDLSEMLKETDLLLDAKREARALIESDPELLLPQHGHLRVITESVLKKPLDL